MTFCSHPKLPFLLNIDFTFFCVVDFGCVIFIAGENTISCVKERQNPVFFYAGKFLGKEAS